MVCRANAYNCGKKTLIWLHSVALILAREGKSRKFRDMNTEVVVIKLVARVANIERFGSLLQPLSANL